MTSFLEWLGAIVIVLGAATVFVGALGLLRFPDAFTRISGTSVAAFTGVAMVFLGVALAVSEWVVWSRTLIVLATLGCMIPISSHALARFAYRSGVRISSRTHTNHLARDDVMRRHEITGGENEGLQENPRNV